MCKRRKVDYVRGQATFVDAQTIQLADGSQRSFRNCILATGSSPVIPAALKIDDPSCHGFDGGAES